MFSYLYRLNGRRILSIVARIVLSVLLALFVLHSCARLLMNTLLTEQSDMPPYVASTLVAADKTVFPLNETAQALLALSPDRHEHLLIFLHGMGPYPNKAWRENAFTILSDAYDADVLLFNWQSWIDFRTLPTWNAARNGKDLAQFMHELDAALRQSDTAYQRRSLLVHSMGARVLAAMTEHHAPPLPENLFDTLIILAAEIDLQDHARWVENITIAQRIYILVNQRDAVLDPPEAYFGKHRLGKGITRVDGTNEALARNATYIHMDKGTRAHSSHIRGQSLGVKTLFHALFMDNPDALTKWLANTPDRNRFRLRPDPPTPPSPPSPPSPVTSSGNALPNEASRL